MSLRRVVISGGGTGGHIFPAIAIANEIKAQHPDCEFLFIGANGKMEMEKVPQAGYNIVGLDVAGLKRSLSPKNIMILIKFLRSSSKAKKIIKKFNPDVAIGVGGYASAPTLKAAAKLGITTIVQEQNSFAGLTNKMLGKNAKKVCVAYEGMERFFDKSKIEITGNPVRSNVVQIEGKRDQAINHFNLDPSKKTLLILGGSLGARTINQSVQKEIDNWGAANIQILWQCGKFYADDLQAFMKANPKAHVKLHPFIMEMDLAYAAADVIVSRAGAISVSEICIVGKPAIFVPSPNVAEDHQTKNALALVKNEAAIMVTDAEAPSKLGTTVIELLNNSDKCAQLSQKISEMGKPNATKDIVKIIEVSAS